MQVAVRWAAEHRVPVVPRGAGSGLSGGSSAVDDGIVLSLERMAAIEIDTDCQVAVVEPGALNAAVKAAAAGHGLWYPPDPSSYEICSIGGNVATNAGGLCCVKYGVTTDYVLGLDVVLADGTLVTLGGKRIKDVAGLSLMKLFVGSEGTLGWSPGDPASGPGTGGPFDDGGDLPERRRRGARGRRRTPFDPAVDAGADGPGSINAVEDHRPMGLDREAGALLVAQSDAPGTSRSAEVELMDAACRAAGATEVFVTDDADEGELFVEARRIAFPAIEARGALFLEDVGAPIPLLPDLLAAIGEVGDGVRRRDPGGGARRRRQHAPDHRVRRRRPRRGEAGPGGVRRDHGAGDRARRHHHRRARRRPLQEGGAAAQLGPDVMALSQRVKDALDPDGILNPGAVL